MIGNKTYLSLSIVLRMDASMSVVEEIPNVWYLLMGMLVINRAEWNYIQAGRHRFCSRIASKYYCCRKPLWKTLGQREPSELEMKLSKPFQPRALSIYVVSTGWRERRKRKWRGKECAWHHYYSRWHERWCWHFIAASKQVSLLRTKNRAEVMCLKFSLIRNYYSYSFEVSSNV